jgi:Phage tail assembly chaperone proteins, E, or 41 or 14
MQVTLPIQGDTIELRSPKGRDLRKVANSVQEGATSFDLMYTVITILATPEVTVDQLDEMDAQDVQALVEAVRTFRVFSASPKEQPKPEHPQQPLPELATA